MRWTALIDGVLWSAEEYRVYRCLTSRSPYTGTPSMPESPQTPSRFETESPMQSQVCKPTRALQPLYSIPQVGALRESTHPTNHGVIHTYVRSHLQIFQGCETLEQPGRQGREGVASQVPVGVEGTQDEPRRDDKFCHRQILPTIHDHQHSVAWPPTRTGAVFGCTGKMAESSPTRDDLGTILIKMYQGRERRSNPST